MFRKETTSSEMQTDVPLLSSGSFVVVLLFSKNLGLHVVIRASVVARSTSVRGRIRVLVVAFCTGPFTWGLYSKFNVSFNFRTY